MYLIGGLSVDTLPSDPVRLRTLAVGLGAADTLQETAETQFQRSFEERMRETRQITDRIFYKS